ncbi:hypothetical protein BC940DRAFT_303063, partial [Gongronella butleri]
MVPSSIVSSCHTNYKRVKKISNQINIPLNKTQSPRLTSEVKEDILRRLRTGESATAIAADHNVARSTVSFMRISAKIPTNRPQYWVLTSDHQIHVPPLPLPATTRQIKKQRMANDKNSCTIVTRSLAASTVAASARLKSELDMESQLVKTEEKQFEDSLPLCTERTPHNVASVSSPLKYIKFLDEIPFCIL